MLIQLILEVSTSYEVMVNSSLRFIHFVSTKKYWWVRFDLNLFKSKFLCFEVENTEIRYTSIALVIQDSKGYNIEVCIIGTIKIEATYSIIQRILHTVCKE